MILGGEHEGQRPERRASGEQLEGGVGVPPLRKFLRILSQMVPSPAF